MTVTEINLSEWVLKGEGQEGESYEREGDPSKLLKLYHEKFNFEEAEHEFTLASLVYALGLATPQPGAIVSCGKRKGVIYHAIQNKRSLCRVISQQPQRLEEMAARLAADAKLLHTLPLSRLDDLAATLQSSAGAALEKNSDLKEKNAATLEKNFESGEGAAEVTRLDDYRVAMRRQCSSRPLPAKIKAGIEKMIDEAPAADCFNHGDLHFGNVITDEHKDYFIDLGRFKLGTADYDNSTLYFVCHMLPATKVKENFHISARQARRFWVEYARQYYGAEAASHIEVIERWAIAKAELICATLGFNPIVFYLLSGNFKALRMRRQLFG